jgi:hypothetical protein
VRFASSDNALVFVTKGERVAIMEVLSRRSTRNARAFLLTLPRFGLAGDFAALKDQI